MTALVSGTTCMERKRNERLLPVPSLQESKYVGELPAGRAAAKPSLKDLEVEAELNELRRRAREF